MVLKQEIFQTSLVSISGDKYLRETLKAILVAHSFGQKGKNIQTSHNLRLREPRKLQLDSLSR